MLAPTCSSSEVSESRSFDVCDVVLCDLSENWRWPPTDAKIPAQDRFWIAQWCCKYNEEKLVKLAIFCFSSLKGGKRLQRIPGVT